MHMLDEIIDTCVCKWAAHRGEEITAEEGGYLDLEILLLEQIIFDLLFSLRCGNMHLLNIAIQFVLYESQLFYQLRSSLADATLSLKLANHGLHRGDVLGHSYQWCCFTLIT